MCRLRADGGLCVQREALRHSQMRAEVVDQSMEVSGREHGVEHFADHHPCCYQYTREQLPAYEVQGRTLGERLVGRDHGVHTIDDVDVRKWQLDVVDRQRERRDRLMGVCVWRLGAHEGLEDPPDRLSCEACARQQHSHGFVAVIRDQQNRRGVEEVTDDGAIDGAIDHVGQNATDLQCIAAHLPAKGRPKLVENADRLPVARKGLLRQLVVRDGAGESFQDGADLLAGEEVRLVGHLEPQDGQMAPWRAGESDQPDEARGLAGKDQGIDHGIGAGDENNEQAEEPEKSDHGAGNLPPEALVLDL